MTWDGESQQRFLARIAAESARLGRLVGDLLDFSAIESGMLRLQRDWCDLPLVLDAAVACLPPPGTGMVEVECDPGLPVVWADHDRLEQVFVNLLDNAIGHNPPGTRVTVSAAPARAGRGADQRDRRRRRDAARAGRRAVRADAARRRTRTAGAGLGLSIANGIVAAHGGQIELEQPGLGTRFRIFLPVELPGLLTGDGEPAGRPQRRQAPAAAGLVPAVRNGPALRVVGAGEITRDEAGAGDR